MKYLRHSWISCSLLVISFSFINYSPDKLQAQALPLILIQTPIESPVPNTVQDEGTKTNKTSAQSFTVCEEEDDICQIINRLITQDQKPTFLGHFFLAGGSIILIGLSFFILKIYADMKAKHWMGYQRSKYEFPFTDEDLKLIIPESRESKRLENQWQEIHKRLKRHKDVMIFFYQQYYISISMTSGLFIIAGICLFFITQVGFMKANPALKNIFIVTVSAGLLYQRLPLMFKHDINLGSNRGLYLKYVELSNELTSYLATKLAKNIDSQNPNQLSEVEPKQFIHYIDKKLAELNQIPIEFDATRVIKLNDLKDTLNVQPETPTLSSNTVDSNNIPPKTKTTPQNK
jgi:hypothetical protein